MNAEPEDFTGLPDLASRALGGTVVYASDEFFADAHHLIEPRPAGPRSGGLRGPRQGVRRLGDPAAAGTG